MSTSKYMTYEVFLGIWSLFGRIMAVVHIEMSPLGNFQQFVYFWA